MPVEIRAITDAEISAYRETMMTVFGADPDADTGGDAQHRALVGPGQSWGAFDRGQMVATAATFDLAISLPGGASIPMAGLTMVSVRPSHRRQGILRELMRRHLDDARTRGFAISGLWASEAPIYQRWSYGLASYCDIVEIQHAPNLRFTTRDTDEIEWIDEARARELLPGVYARATTARPGALRRTDTWWRERRFLETAWSRQGASKRRHVIARRGDEAVGYLVYRQRGKFTDGVPDGRVEINELLAVDARAEATLWKFATNVDLFPTVAWWNAPADDGLAWMVDDMRRIKKRRSDGLWLRIEDVATALAARGYTSDGSLLFVVDNDKRFELVVEDGRARCTPTTRTPALAFSTQTLGSLYLGTASATQLARAGLVQGRPDAILVADRLFSSSLAPWCPEIF